MLLVFSLRLRFPRWTYQRQAVKWSWGGRFRLQLRQRDYMPPEESWKFTVFSNNMDRCWKHMHTHVCLTNYPAHLYNPVSLIHSTYMCTHSSLAHHTHTHTLCHKITDSHYTLGHQCAANNTLVLLCWIADAFGLISMLLRWELAVNSIHLSLLF